MPGKDLMERHQGRGGHENVIKDNESPGVIRKNNNNNKNTAFQSSLEKPGAGDAPLDRKSVV